MSLILPANSLTGGYEIDNSLRFNDGSADYLSKTFTGTQTNNKKATVSFWWKRSAIDNTGINNGQQTIISWNNGLGNRGFIRSEGSTNQLRFTIITDSGATVYGLEITPVQRDISAWYHIVGLIDTTQSTASDRMKIYINGEQITSFDSSSYPPQNETNICFGEAEACNIGRDVKDSNSPLDGYLAEMVFIDGQALTPTSFGEFDQDTNIWKPIKYTGTYGTNGFYLDFENSGSLGADQSGNGNNFTVNNLTSIDQVTDTPTNNFSTLNPLANGLTMSEGNLSVAGASDNNTGATIGVKSGKWYWEVKDVGGVSSFGIANSANRIGTSNQSSATGMYLIQSIGSGSWYSYTNGSFASTSVPVHSAGDILNFALDADNGKLYIGKNGSYINSSNSSANPATDTNPFFSSISTAEFLIPFTEMRTGGGDADFNFGNPPYSANGYTDGAGYGNFSYAVPSGFYSLNSKNLAQYG